MENKLQTSQSKPLTTYKKGVTFLLKTPSHEYSLDADTAEKLSNIILTQPDVKFTKINTSEGQIVINTSSIMSIATDETEVKSIKSSLLRLKGDQKLADKETMYTKMVGDMLYRGKTYPSRDLFDYVYDLVRNEK